MASPPPPPRKRTKPPAPPGAERRNSERVELLAQVELTTTGGEVTLVPVVNIAIGGALLQVDGVMVAESFRRGDAVKVFVDLGADASFALDASVVRIEVDDTTTKVALMWVGISSETAKKLARAIKLFEQ